MFGALTNQTCVVEIKWYSLFSKLHLQIESEASIKRAPQSRFNVSIESKSNVSGMIIIFIAGHIGIVWDNTLCIIPHFAVAVML